jgi:hypothetical protein
MFSVQPGRLLRSERRGFFNRMLQFLRTGLSGTLVSTVFFVRPLVLLGSMVFVQYSGSKGEVYNILWVLVFGFATLNILGLVAKRFEPDRNRLNFGEFLAVLVVVVSIALLAMELLSFLHIFPIKLKPHDADFAI